MTATIPTAPPARYTSVFADFEEEVYPYRYQGEIVVEHLVGGIPQDPNKVEGWLRSKIEDDDRLLEELIMETLVEIGGDFNNPLDREEATKKAASKRNLNGFKRDRETGELYIEGRQLKAAIKESSNILWATERWGPTRKGTKSFFAEHLFIVENRLGLGVDKPTGVQQRFVHTFRGTGIQLEEYVEEARFSFTLITDYDFSKTQWGQLWKTAEKQGVGATRSQGFGTYVVTQWDKLPEAAPSRNGRAKKSAKATTTAS